MMQALTGRYGEMLPTGERQAHEVRVDLARTVMSAYDLWKQVAEQGQLTKFVYDEAVSILNASGVPDAHVSQESAVEIISLLQEKDRSFDLAGLFASALVNVLPISVLEAKLVFHIFGYRLAQGKTIIALPESAISTFGLESVGNIFSYGDVRMIGSSQGGLAVSYNSISEAELFQGGTFLNFGKYIGRIIFGINGVFVNLSKEMSSFCYFPDGVVVDYRKKAYDCPTLQGCVFFMPNRMEKPWLPNENSLFPIIGHRAIAILNDDVFYHGTCEPVQANDAVQQRILALSGKLKQLADNYLLFERFRASPVGLTDYVNGRDWKGLEKQIFETGRQIHEAVR